MADRQCVICSDFVTSDEELMKRHVAIVHGESAFSTLKCEVCKRKYYDFDNFKDHIRESPVCSSESLKITPVQLTQDMKNAFDSLVEQIMKPAQVQLVQIRSTEGQSSMATRRTRSTMDTENGGQSKIPVAMNSTTQQKDGSVPVLKRAARRSVGRNAHYARLSSIRVSTATGIGNGGKKKQKRRGRKATDLGLHCRQIILKRQCKNRLTCQLCKRSIAAVSNDGYPHSNHAMDHARCHLSSPIFKCKKCDFKSNAASNMRRHLHDHHSAATNQYIDTTADRFDELMQLVTRCFDHGFQTNSPNGPKGIKRPFIEQREPIGCKKRIKSSMTLEKNNIGTQFETVGASKLSKMRQGSLSNGQCIRQTSVLPAHLRAQKEICTKQVKTYVKDGKLECKVCQQLVTVSRTDHSDLWNIRRAYDHAIMHLRDVDLFECTACIHRTSTVVAMYQHVRQSHCPDQRKFIDHTTKFYPKILRQFMACFDLKNTGQDVGTEQGTQTTGAGNGMGENGEASSASKPVDSTEDTKNGLVCSKCGYKTTYQMLLLKHKKIMHGEY